MANKSTPGPWTYDIHEHSFYIYGPDMAMVADGDPDDAGIARMRGVGRGADAEEQEANARLIAAAPDLLESLFEMTSGMPPADAPCHKGLVAQEECGHCSRIARALTAIGKAVGAQ